MTFLAHKKKSFIQEICRAWVSAFPEQKDGDKNEILWNLLSNVQTQVQSHKEIHQTKDQLIEQGKWIDYDDLIKLWRTNVSLFLDID